MDEINFLKNYIKKYKETLFDTDAFEEMITMKKLLLEAKSRGNKFIIAGNGGSAAIASHASVDFTKQAKIRTINFNEYDLITCFANDYGYENWISKALESYGEKGDIITLISSSGNSENMIKAAQVAKKMQIKVITFTGFSKSNSLKSHGDLNFWINSKAYNVVENIHQIWLLMVCDLIIGKMEYSA